MAGAIRRALMSAIVIRALALALACSGCHAARTVAPQSRTPSRSFAAPETAMNRRDSSGAKFQWALDAAVARNRGFGGGILRIESATGELVWQGASGGLASNGPALRPTDAFEIASVTKTFVAVAVLRLVEDERVQLDAPIGRYLPPDVTRGIVKLHGVDYGPSITVRQLLAHRAGLPDYWTDPPFVPGQDGTNAFLVDFLRDVNRLWTPGELVAYLPRLTPIARPGLRYHYTDSAYVILGLLIEHAVGVPLHEHIRTALIEPLKLTETWWAYREPPVSGTREAHRYEGAIDLQGQRRQSADWGGGGLVSTTRDLGSFARSLLSGRVFKRPETLATMQSWQSTGEPAIEYGLGLFRVALDRNAGEMWGHDGHGNAFMFYWPKGRLWWIGTLDQTENSWWDMVEPLLSRFPG